MITNNSKILDGYSQSSGSVSTSAFRVQNFNGVSISVTVSSQSSYGATAKLQASNDPGLDAQGGGTAPTFIDLPNSGNTANIALASDGGYLWNIPDVYYKWIRVVITWSAGSATLDVRANGKGINAQ